MAQTEDMKRLLKDGKIVGYQKKDQTFDGRLIDIYSDNLDNWWGAKDGRNPIDHDSFEQGIKVDGEWWFEGDKGSHEVLRDFILKWDEEDGSFYLDHPAGGRSNHAVAHLALAKKIGSIHDKKED